MSANLIFKQANVPILTCKKNANFEYTTRTCQYDLDIFISKSIYLSTEGRLFHSEFTYPDTMWTKNFHILDINVPKLGLHVCGFSHV